MKNLIDTSVKNLIETTADAVEVLRVMREGGWELSCPEPWSALTEEAQARMRWHVRRTDAPFCGPDGMRAWSGPTAIDAINTARAALGMR